MSIKKGLLMLFCVCPIADVGAGIGIGVGGWLFMARPSARISR
jgi:hypothetical protein